MRFKRFPNDASTARDAKDAKERQELEGEGKHRGPVAAQVPVWGV
jgi:hypothetical protein